MKTTGDSAGEIIVASARCVAPLGNSLIRNYSLQHYIIHFKDIFTMIPFFSYCIIFRTFGTLVGSSLPKIEVKKAKCATDKLTT